MGRNEARNWGINLVDKISSIERSHVCGKRLLPSSDSHTYTHTHSRSHATEKLLQRIHKANWWSFSCGICTTWRVRCQTDGKGRAHRRSPCSVRSALLSFCRFLFYTFCQSLGSLCDGDCSLSFLAVSNNKANAITTQREQIFCAHCAAYGIRCSEAKLL